MSDDYIPWWIPPEHALRTGAAPVAEAALVPAEVAPESVEAESESLAPGDEPESLSVPGAADGAEVA